MKGNISRIRDLVDVLGPHLYTVYITESTSTNLRSFALLSAFSWGGTNEATPHYPTLERRVFGDLGFRVYR